VNLGPITAGTPSVVAIGLAVLALVVAVSAQRRISAIQARYRDLWDAREKDLIAVVSHQTSKLTNLRNELERVRVRLSLTEDDVEQSLRHVSVVRYDAFGEMSGQRSFSAAIVDDQGDGLVISSINARGESRTYAKGVLEGLSEITLTLEEEQALAGAHKRRVA
jgi:Protein of unknown function (DUF4446)